MFRLKKSSSGQLLNHVWGTSSESAHFWGSQNVCNSERTWVQMGLVFTILYILKCIYIYKSPSGQLLNHVWGTSSESAHFRDPKMFTNGEKTWVKMRLLFTILYILKCIYISHHQFNYWTMFEVHQVKVHIFGIPKCLQTARERGYKWGWYLQYYIY